VTTIDDDTGEVLVAVAARVGPTRLIDNTILRLAARVPRTTAGNAATAAPAG
jgi:hypothetical protein